MIESEIIEIMNTRLLTLELIVSEIHDTLISNGVIDKKEFDLSINKKIKELKKISDTIESELENDFNFPNMFNGPIGEA